MSYSGYGALAAIGFVAVVGAYTAIDRSMNYQPAKAAVFLIDRQCKFTRVYSDGKRESVTQSCDATEEFKKIATSEKRSTDIDGKAVIKVSYTAPQDGSYRTAELRFDGRDDQFYALKAGDTVDVLVSNDDPSKVIED